ncbi:hypothetical protein FOL47_004061 [Perkinsus chesapeaki]|uniref:subtilisin n=1 Tax=Perkinsus chesapeaki TaxID=330153 RepID=A0A7J6M620_PERCH|nr:hypothetical protein FOL47_004061 [Perkinsus chesapeaki]
MTVFADMITLSRLSEYIFHCYLVWSFGGSPARKAFGQLPYPPNDLYFSLQRALFDSLHIQETWKAQPDLVGKLLEGKDASGSTVPSVEDVQGHGTEMTSIIAAGINNGIGIAGIADRVKIRPIRLSTSPTGSTDVQVKRAWELANTFKDSDVIVFASGGLFTHEKSTMFKRVIKKAVEQGNFVVVGASNNDAATGPSEVLLPCSLANSMPGVVCVAATLTSIPEVLSREAALLASFGVPATEVMVAEMRNEVGQWKYGEIKGSSCATAIVGGIAALMQSFKKFKPDEMKEILLNATEGKVRTAKGVEMLYGVLRPDLAVKRAIGKTSLRQESNISMINLLIFLTEGSRGMSYD